jgi:hypothetical protein
VRNVAPFLNSNPSELKHSINIPSFAAFGLGGGFVARLRFPIFCKNRSRYCEQKCCTGLRRTPHEYHEVCTDISFVVDVHLNPTNNSNRTFNLHYFIFTLYLQNLEIEVIKCIYLKECCARPENVGFLRYLNKDSSSALYPSQT